MQSSRRQWLKAAPVAVVSAVAGARVASAVELPSEPILKFTSMAGNEPDVIINGNESDDEGWDVFDADGILTLDGHLRIAVIGLVFDEGPDAGRNTFRRFRAIVSCTTLDQNGVQTVVNRSTEDFPATVPGGNSLIISRVTIPNPCFAPIIFVGPGAGLARNTLIAGGEWFASTGMKIG
jgi:hypothetical protein